MDPIHSPIHTPLHVPGVAFIAIPRHVLNLLGLLQRNPKLCLFAVAFVGLTDLENLSHLRCGASRSLGVFLILRFRRPFLGHGVIVTWCR